MRSRGEICLITNMLFYLGVTFVIPAVAVLLSQIPVCNHVILLALRHCTESMVQMVFGSLPSMRRLNDSPVRGYEDDVGNKTTMRFFYPESASYNPTVNNEPDTIMVLVPFKQQDLRWLKEILYDEKRVL